MSRWSAADLNRLCAQEGITQFAGRASRTSKYGNKPTIVDGYVFDSKLEGKRYGELKLLKMTGHIQDLVLQKSYALHVNGVQIGKYLADFTYLEDGKEIIEDCKGFRTPLYRWKKAHVYAEYGISIKEITS